MEGNYEFHKFFGHQPPDIISTYQSPYYSHHFIYEEAGKEGYQSHPKPFRVENKLDLKAYIQDSQSTTDGPLDFEQIICVINPEEFDPNSDKETLIFYEDGCMIRTNEPSGEFMNRLFKHSGISYDQMREWMRLINSGQPVHSCPYVKGQLAFMPTYGPSKQNVSWISLAHAIDCRKISKDGQQTRIEFFNRHYFDFPIPTKVLDHRIDVAAKLYAFQHRRFLESAHDFGISLIQGEKRLTQNILHRRMEKLSALPQVNSLDLVEQMMGITYREWKKDKGNLKKSPYLEELDELFLS